MTSATGQPTMQADFDRWDSALAASEFEPLFSALEACVACLESGQLPLADAVRCYEYGARLSRACEQVLASAELRIREIDADMAPPDSVPDPDFDDVPF